MAKYINGLVVIRKSVKAKINNPRRTSNTMLRILIATLVLVNLTGALGAFTASPRPISIYGTSVHWPELSKLDSFRYEIDSFIQFIDRIFMITKNDQVYVMGKYDEYALLGLGDSVHQVDEPTEIVELREKQVIKLCSGYEHTLALTATGNIWGWGYNDDGKLGLGNTSSFYNPVMMLDVNNAIDISCGTHSSYYLTEDKELYSVGYNHKGQLGIGTTEDVATPQRVDLEDVVSVVADGGATGYYDIVALTSKGRLYTWGQKSEKKKPTEIRLVDDKFGQSVTATSELHFILSDYGQIFVNANGTTPILFYDGDVRFRSLYSDLYYDYLVAETFYKEIYLWKNVNNGGSSYQKISSTMLADSFGIFSYPPWMTFMISLLDDGSHEAGVLERMFNNQVVSDFQFVVEGKSIYVNRDVLTVTSEYMKKQFESDWRLKSQFNVEGYKYQVYYNYLFYLYTSNLKLSRDQAIELMALAVSLGENKLKQRCHDIISKSF